MHGCQGCSRPRPARRGPTWGRPACQSCFNQLLRNVTMSILLFQTRICDSVGCNPEEYIYVRFTPLRWFGSSTNTSAVWLHLKVQIHRAAKEKGYTHVASAACVYPFVQSTTFGITFQRHHCIPTRGASQKKNTNSVSV